MNLTIKLAGVSLAATMLAASAGSAAAQTAVCYAFQDLSTGFWVAGHGAIVETLKAGGVEVIELNGGHDANRQLEQVKDCIAQGGDGIILTADDGDSGTVVVAEAQESDVPIATFNRPPSDMTKGIIVVADNEAVARAAVDAMVDEAKKKMAATGQKLKPLILMGDLGDPNAVQRRAGFMNSIGAHPDLFEAPVEVATKWNSQVALAGLEAAMTADPSIDFISPPRTSCSRRSSRCSSRWGNGRSRARRGTSSSAGSMAMTAPVRSSRRAMSTPPACRTSISRPSWL